MVEPAENVVEQRYPQDIPAGVEVAVPVPCLVTARMYEEAPPEPPPPPPPEPPPVVTGGVTTGGVTMGGVTT